MTRLDQWKMAKVAFLPCSVQ